MPLKAIKGQALVDFLVAHLVPDDPPLAKDLPNERSWLYYPRRDEKYTSMVLARAQQEKERKPSR